MEYLKKYDLNELQIKELEDKYNDRIIKFINSESEFISEKLEYLKQKDYIIFPILENNIRIVLEEMYYLQNKMQKMKEKGYSKKVIQMILMDEQLYDKI